MAVVTGKFDVAVFSGLACEALDFRHGFFGDQGTGLIGEPGKRVVGFSECQAMTVCGDHRDRVGL